VHEYVKRNGRIRSGLRLGLQRVRHLDHCVGFDYEHRREHLQVFDWNVWLRFMFDGLIDLHILRS
jgi:hypothetical protein